jgi:hypothetical protein
MLRLPRSAKANPVKPAVAWYAPIGQNEKSQRFLDQTAAGGTTEPLGTAVRALHCPKHQTNP